MTLVAATWSGCAEEAKPGHCEQALAHLRVRSLHRPIVAARVAPCSVGWPPCRPGLPTGDGGSPMECWELSISAGVGADRCELTFVASTGEEVTVRVNVMQGPAPGSRCSEGEHVFEDRGIVFDRQELVVDFSLADAGASDR